MNKRPSMAVHPAPGCCDGTLVNGPVYEQVGLSGTVRSDQVLYTGSIKIHRDGGYWNRCRSSCAQLSLRNTKGQQALSLRDWGKPKADEGFLDMPHARHPFVCATRAPWS